ncbi:LPXTG cell wall anchor domain-containing protein [Kitasatospora sp. NPDC097605]|uniref:LPXTG cell wall anchor domain-containing protein n=1 Tax=Kitasatospora sp. NPDC097605 TaxID=3157226 RepID=UPI00332E2F07
MSLSIPRSLALAGAAALAASMALTGAQGAVAAATGSAAVAPQADKVSPRALDLSLDGVPRTFAAGGDSKLFNFTVDNNTKQDFVYYPLLKFKNPKGTLRGEHLKVEYQLPESLDKSKTWLPAKPAPGGGEGDDDGVLFLLAKLIEGGFPDYKNSLLAVTKGSSLTVTVRVSVTKDAPLGTAGVVPVVFAAKAEGNNPSGQGEFVGDGSCGDRFRIVAGGGKPSPTATPSTTKPTSPSASPTVKPTGSPSATTSPSATGTPSATATPTGSPSATATPSTSTSPSATGTPSATATPSATSSTTPSATASPSGSASPSASPTATTTSGASASPSASVTTAPTTPAPGDTEGEDGTGVRQPIDFPVKVPAIAPLPITPEAVVQARSNADKALATTGGGDDTTVIAIAGGAVLAAGVGTLVVLRRRRAAQQG